MKIIFIGGLFPHDRVSEFINNSKGVVQFAANAFQWSFINGLDRYFNDFSIYTAPLLGNFPNTYKRIYTKKSEFSHTSKSKDYCVGYLQIPLISLISKSLNIYRSLISNEKTKNPYIVVYCVHTPFLLAAVRYKKKFPESRICLIVADLPEYMSSKSGTLYSLLKKIDLKLINYLVRNVDSFVFTTDLMASHFNVVNKPWIRIEGMYYSQGKSEIEIVSSYDKMIILYTGTLDARYGISDLIEAFKMLDHSDYELWICGDGNMKKHIFNYIEEDRRVKYFGQVSHDEAITLQQKATILVNPRTSLGEYTKYSFPLKTMEYLASGKPCIMHHLPGIPKEYVPHLFIPDDETPLSLSRKIVEVCNMDKTYLIEHCRKSRSFILNEKNPEIQISKLATMLNE